jgi:hypothetical protein
VKKIPKQEYTAEFKDQAVKRAEVDAGTRPGVTSAEAEGNYWRQLASQVTTVAA